MEVGGEPDLGGHAALAELAVEPVAIVQGDLKTREKILQVGGRGGGAAR